MSDWVFPQDDDYKHIKSEFGYLEKQANIKLLKSQPQHYWKFVGLCQETNSAKKRGQTCSQNYEAECLDYDLKTKLGLLVGMSTLSKATHQVRIMTGEHHALKNMLHQQNYHLSPTPLTKFENFLLCLPLPNEIKD